MSQRLSLPDSSEYAEYYGKYIQLVPEADIVHAMKLQLKLTLEFLETLPESIGDKRYAPEKWSVKEVVGHIIDVERVFTQRALFFARNSPVALPGMEQDDWMKEAAFGAQRLEDLATEFGLVRQSNVWFFRNLSDVAWMRRGVASNREFTVRAIAYIIVGHERHHLGILKTRYL